jgi:MFS family permease
VDHQEGKPDRQAKAGLAFLLLIGFINYIDRAAFGVLQVPIKTELGLSDSELGVLTGLAFFIPYSLFAVPLGRLADLWNRKYLLALGVLLWSVMTGLIGLVEGFLLLLVLRMGFAIGESAYLPASYSMLADYFAPSWRGRAIALFALAYPIGSMLGIAGAGVLANAIGWRGVFWVFGALGVVLVPIFLFVVREPVRGAQSSPSAGAAVEPAPAPTFGAAVRILWKVRSLRYMAIAAGLQTYVAAVVIAWSVPFYMRVHEVSLGNVSLVFAVITGIGGTIGTFAAGYVSDRLGRTDRRWYIWMPVLTCLATVPATLVQLLVPSIVVSFACAGVVASVVSAFSPPTFAITQSLVAPNLRALASSFIATCVAIGGAFGPTITGIVSDFLRGAVTSGPEALRFAMCTVVIPSALAAALFYRASSSVAPSETADTAQSAA